MSAPTTKAEGPVGADPWEARARRAGLSRAAQPPSPSPWLYHSDDERLQALASIQDAFDALRVDVESRATAPDAPPARRQWWIAEVQPAIADWTVFHDHETSSWLLRTATDWLTYREWWLQVKELRAEARAHGLELTSPEPAPLPLTWFELAATGRGSRIDTVAAFAKTALWLALTVTGVAAIYSNLRSRWRDRSSAAGRASS
jgi:hypothetical protein